ncbi:MAG: hypothetical protein O3A95_00155 [Planctomycetota bacterium]|nr:hypothetical protein [Planctomycetota bacterium]MDA1112701.1 hypothetical protein [Planctomycetota bacterium]
MRILPILPFLAVGAIVGILLSEYNHALATDAVATQQKDSIELLGLTHEPYWNSTNVDDDTPRLLLRVPKGSRFVLTDMWFLSREEQYLPVNEADRVWLECQHGSNRLVVFDSPIAELRLPLQWQTGVAFSEGQEMWVNYRSADETDLLRRIHFTGYFEPMLEAPKR